MEHSKYSPAKIESFIDDCLKKNLQQYEKELYIINAETVEYVQLKNTIEVMLEHFLKGFKTKVNIGSNFFMQANVKDTSKILVNIGLDHYIEFTLEEALKFVNMKIRILKKHAEVVRDETIKTKSEIKLALLCLSERDNMNLK